MTEKRRRLPEDGAAKIVVGPADGWPLALGPLCGLWASFELIHHPDFTYVWLLAHVAFRFSCWIVVPTPKRCQRAPRQRYGSEAAEAKTFAPTSPDQRLLSLPPTANGEVSVDDVISWSGPTEAKLFAALSPRHFLNGLSPLRVTEPTPPWPWPSPSSALLNWTMSALLRHSSMCKKARRVRIAQSLPSPRSRRCGYRTRRDVLDPTPPPDPRLSLSGPARLFSLHATRPSDHVQRGAPGSHRSVSAVSSQPSLRVR